MKRFLILACLFGATVPLFAEESASVPIDAVGGSTDPVNLPEDAPPDLLLDRRLAREKQWREEGLSLIPYRLSYFFPFTYNSSPNNNIPGVDSERAGAKFQLSIKVLLIQSILQSDVHLYFGYTQLSMWQVYDRDDSSPFRDNNYEPEIMFTVDRTYSLGKFTARHLDVGFSHQSNGQPPPLSRSWNRIYANAVMERNGIIIGFKPWYRIPESESEDDNPDMDKFMGYGEFSISYLMRNHLISVMVRNNLRGKSNRGAVQVDYTFPMTRTLNGLVQYFNGYGESLIDYNHSNNRVSIGLALSPWN